MVTWLKIDCSEKPYIYDTVKKRSLLLLILFIATVWSSQARPKPSWMTELPLPGNNTYIYVKEAGQDRTPSGSLNKALIHVFETTSKRIGRAFDSEEAFAQLQKGVKYEDIVLQYSVPVNLVDHYTTKEKDGTFWTYVLCQVSASKDVPPIWDRGKNIDMNYNWTCLFRSIVPGVGQMSKGYVGEGVFTLVGETLLVGGAVGCYFLAEKQFEQMQSAVYGDQTYNSARSNYNTLKSTQSFLWGAAGALYILNFVRAFTLDPKSTSNLAVVPSVMSTPYTTAPTLGLTLKF